MSKRTAPPNRPKTADSIVIDDLVRVSKGLSPRPPTKAEVAQHIELFGRTVIEPDGALVGGVGPQPSFVARLLALMDSPVGDSPIIHDVQFIGDRLHVQTALSQSGLTSRDESRERRAEVILAQLVEIAQRRLDDARVTYLETVRTARRLGLVIDAEVGHAAG